MYNILNIIFGVFGLIGTFLAIASSNIYKKIKYKNKISYTLGKKETEWIIIYPKYYFKELSVYQFLARIEDIYALLEIKKHLDLCSIKYIEQDDSMQMPIDKNIFLICGPKANKISKLLIDDINITYLIKTDENDNRYIYDEISNIKYYSNVNNDSNKNSNTPTKFDFAILSKCTIKTTNQKAILLWGLSGVGTIGASKMLFDNNFIKEIKYKFNSECDFQAIIRVPFMSDYTIGSLEIETLKKCS